MRRLFSLAAAAALLPACDGDGGGGGGSTSVFRDRFDRSVIGSSWIGSGDVRLDDSEALRLTPTATAESTTAFVAPFTAGVDVDVLNAGDGVGGVEFLDESGTFLASAERSGDAGGGATFTIGAVSRTLGLSAGVQRLTIRVDSRGDAAWSLNDTVVLTGTGFPMPGFVRLRLYAHPVPAAVELPVFLFDNVDVTSP